MIETVEPVVHSSASPQTSQQFSIDNIALSFSGGGYRAAAFHLGVLDFLHQVDLLEQVTMLSTVSGGSLTGAKYVQSLCENSTKNQPDFYQSFYRIFHGFLQTQRLPDRWLKQLQSQDQSRPMFRGVPRPLSLAQAAARIYARPIMDGGLVGPLTLGKIKEVQAQFHLKEIIFNTTELNTGLDFRFYIGKGGQVGNNKFRLKSDFADQVYLADVVAASSCFPGGFEPLLFPQDFQWSQEPKKRNCTICQIRSTLLKDDSANPTQERTLPLMDGGLYDNLGVDALLLADKRLKEQERIGTLIVSDTDNIGLDDAALNKIGKKADLFKVPKIQSNKGLFSIKLSFIASFIPILFIIFLVSTIVVGLVTLNEFLIFKNLFFCFLGIWITLVFALITFGFGWLTDAVQTLVSSNGIYAPSKTSDPNNLPAIEAFLEPLRDIIVNWQQFLNTIGELEIADVINLINIRVVSLSSLFIVFLSNQRRKSHDFLYDSANYGNETISCFMYDLPNTLRSYMKKKKIPPNHSFIKDCNALTEMAEIADEATRTPTTLWFDQDQDKAEHQLDTLIACGQFTMCFNLLEHLEVKRAKVGLSPDAQKTYELAFAAWQEFEKNPKIRVGESRK